MLSLKIHYRYDCSSFVERIKIFIYHSPFCKALQNSLPLIHHCSVTHLLWLGYLFDFLFILLIMNFIFTLSSFIFYGHRNFRLTLRICFNFEFSVKWYNCDPVEYRPIRLHYIPSTAQTVPTSSFYRDQRFAFHTVVLRCTAMFSTSRNCIYTYLPCVQLSEVK